jgi:hypothetical protein
LKDVPKSESHKLAISKSLKNKLKDHPVVTIESTCPHCGKTGKGNIMKRWHFDNCAART